MSGWITIQSQRFTSFDFWPFIEFLRLIISLEPTRAVHNYGVQCVSPRMTTCPTMTLWIIIWRDSNSSMAVWQWKKCRNMTVRQSHTPVCLSYSPETQSLHITKMAGWHVTISEAKSQQSEDPEGWLGHACQPPLKSTTEGLLQILLTV